ncbi:1-acyl-sn-glycerol-3-phosphate acyltransferase [Sulfobacillus acidophilus TPY]|uniref:Phospholipid/glycerol acyltransferase n=1 Tax=Sulfobacillus acidophilus (strain ATCC 700253 / DSM 10332 / NAL) TaxID=679936 RepID=G8TYT0_SULAD|nr:1-acyl-sn-glycerol-3-phosphate acyltransferase [Sulfobacillus acidophilus TPY]AEW04045.1 phospholipid/glycerol acyltransferase [Sulfobacillus acidophilus DSM 10332]
MIDRLSRGLIVPLTQWFMLDHLEGTEHIPASGGYLIVANHASFFDHFVVAAVIQRTRGHQVKFLTKKESFEHPLSRWWHTAVGCIPLNRQAADTQAIRATLRALADGQVVCVYPEGTRTLTGFLQSGKPGAALLAALAQVPLLPIGIAGTFDVLPKHRVWPQRQRVTVRIGEPLAIPALPRRQRDAALAEWTQRIMDRLASLSGEPTWPDAVPSEPETSYERRLQAARYWNDRGIQAADQHQGVSAQRYHWRARYITAELLRDRHITADVWFEYGRAVGRLALTQYGPRKLLSLWQSHQAFQHALDLDGNHAHAHYALGLWYQMVPRALGGSVSRALAYFHAATRLAPDQMGFWMGLGRCAMAARQWDVAERAFQHAVQLPAQTVADRRRHLEANAWLLRWHLEQDISEVKNHA